MEDLEKGLPLLFGVDDNVGWWTVVDVVGAVVVVVADAVGLVRIVDTWAYCTDLCKPGVHSQPIFVQGVLKNGSLCSK